MLKAIASSLQRPLNPIAGYGLAICRVMHHHGRAWRLGLDSTRVGYTSWLLLPRWGMVEGHIALMMMMEESFYVFFSYINKWKTNNVWLWETHVVTLIIQAIRRTFTSITTTCKLKKLMPCWGKNSGLVPIPMTFLGIFCQLCPQSNADCRTIDVMYGVGCE